MKFNIIIGNPPYQESTGGGTTTIGATNLYGLFVNRALLFNPDYITMIIPTRWYMGDKGIDKDLKSSLILDRKLKILRDFQRSRNIFTNVDIAGGICYFLWDNKYNGNIHIDSDDGRNIHSFELDALKYGSIIRHKYLISIYEKVERLCEKQGISVGYFGLPTNIDEAIEGTENTIKCKTSTGIIDIDKRDIKSGFEMIDSYKLVTGYKAPDRGGCNNSELWSVISRPQTIEPGIVCTSTYMVLKYADDIAEIDKWEKYLKTKFIRALILGMTPSTTLGNRAFELVPCGESDILLTDKELYEKYNLDSKEINFIETSIREM